MASLAVVTGFESEPAQVADVKDPIDNQRTVDATGSTVIHTFNMRLDPPPGSQSYCLPPLRDIRPLIDDYFAQFNSLLPLFDRVDFMEMLEHYYTSCSEDDSATWAVVNVVLALSTQQCRYHSHCDRGPELQRYISNTQSVMDKLVIRDVDLKGIQVILGLIIIFQCAPDSRPSPILVATAVKLAHRLRLNTTHGQQGPSEKLALQRNRVFWILFILDRDTSLRTREPYLQQGQDMDIELPASTSLDDTTGKIFAPGGTDWLDFFRCRTELAHIQGQVYNLTYSVSAQALPGRDRQSNTIILDSLLRCWKDAIPEVFQPPRFIQLFPEWISRHMTMLFFSYYQSVYKAHAISGFDMDWIRALTEYSGRYNVGNDRDSCQQDAFSPSPSSWPEDMQAARTCLVWYQSINKSDVALIWNLSCTYISSLVIVIANRLICLEHVEQSTHGQDVQLIAEGLLSLKNMTDIFGDERFSMLSRACSELNSRAILAELVFGLPYIDDMPAPDPGKRDDISSFDIINAFIQAGSLRF